MALALDSAAMRQESDRLTSRISASPCGTIGVPCESFGGVTIQGKPSVVLIDLRREGERVARRWRLLSVTPDSDPRRQLLEKETLALQEQYDQRLELALSYVGALRQWHSRKGAAILEARFIDAETWKGAARAGETCETDAKATAAQCLVWLDWMAIHSPWMLED